MRSHRQVWGLELTSASRAGFLVQLTTVIVPVLEAFLGRRKLKPQVSACLLEAGRTRADCGSTVHHSRAFDISLVCIGTAGVVAVIGFALL